MKTFRVTVTRVVDVAMDETKFTAEFMEEFDRQIFHADGLEEHAEHLGQLWAREIATDKDFIEGYGPAPDMGIQFEGISMEVEAEEITLEVKASP